MPFPYALAGQRMTAELWNRLAPTHVSVTLRRYIGQSIATATDTLVTWHDEYEDSNNGHDNTVNPGRWYAPFSGRYDNAVILNWQNSAGGGRRTAWLKVNGGAEYNLESRPSSASALTQTNGSRTIRLNAGEYVEVWCRQESGGAINVDGAARDGSAWSIDYVGP